MTNTSNHDHDHNGNHGHPHCHSHAHSTPESFNLAFAIAVSLNLGFTLLEVFYALMANSMGLLADAVHNFGDIFGLVLAWGANWLLSIPARKRYSYGFKRTTIIAAVANALILVASSAVIGYQSVYKLLHPSEVNEWIVIVIATIGIFVNGGTALLFMKGADSDLNIKGAFTHLMSDAVIAIGVVVAGILIYYTGMMWIDPVIGLIIVVIVLWATWGLLRNSVSLILDAVPHFIDLAEVKHYLQNLPNIVDIHDLHIWGLSTKEVALTAHLVISKNSAASIDYKIINSTLKDKFKINHVTVQVEMENSDFLCVRSESC